MRILHINSAFGLGGASVSVELLQQELKRKDEIYSKLLVGDLYLEHQEDISAINSRWKRWLNVAITRLTGLDSIWYPFVDKRKIKELIDWSELVHVHNLHGYFFPIKLLKLLEDKPVVWTLRDYWLISGRCAMFGFCNKWLQGCGQCRNLKFYPRTWLWDFSHYMFKKKIKYISNMNNVTLVAISKHVKEVIGRSFLADFNVEVIYNAIDFPAVKTTGRNNKQSISYCASYLNNEIKGCKDFYQILLALPGADRYKIIIFGQAIPNRYKLRLINKGFEIEERRYQGNVQQLAETYRASDLFITTSHDETFGKTTVEAMACGVPVMCFDIPIMREIGGRYALYSPAFDIAAFARNIEKFFQTPYPYAGEELQRYAQTFNVAKMTQSYLDLYQRMLRK